MELTLPIILIALSGLVLVTQRNGWVVLGALFAQWVGLALQILPLPMGASDAPIEIVTALGCCGIVGLTIWNLERQRDNRNQKFIFRIPYTTISDQLWLWATALVAGVAGFALAQLYPLGGSTQDLTAFYWIVLPAILALVIDGSRDPVKSGIGILSLFNAGILLVYTFGAASPGVVLLGLAALGRLALAAITGYTWLFFKSHYLDLNLNTVFDLRDGKIATETALAVVPQPVVQQAETGEEEELSGDAE